MALASVTGVISSPAAAGNQTYNLGSPWPAGTTPKALIAWWTNQTVEGSVDHANFCLGFGTYRSSTPQHACVSFNSLDAGTASDAAMSLRVDRLVELMTAGTVVVIARADLVSFASDQFTLNWVTPVPATGTKLHYIALGGTDITDAYVTTFDLDTTSPQDVTVVAGFGQPDLLFFLSSSLASVGTANPVTGGLTSIMLGIAKSDTERMVASFTEEIAGTMLLAYWQLQRAIVHTSATQTADSEADLSARAGWPTDGFELTIPDLPSVATRDHIVLALKGTFKSKISASVAPITGTPPVVQDNDAGFVPKLGFIWGGNLDAKATIDTTHADLGSFGIGATDGTTESWAGFSQEDSAASADTYSRHSESKVLINTLADDGTIVSESDGSFSGNNLRLSWNDIDSVAREYLWLALGDASSASLIYRPRPMIRNI